MKIGYIVGSLSTSSINREVSLAVAGLAPDGVEFVELPYYRLPLYSRDYEADMPEAVLDWKAALDSVDGIIIVTPEYNRSIPGGLKNALDWASRPSRHNSLDRKPVAIAGAAPGAIGTAVAQQHLRTILAHLNAPTLAQPEVYLSFNRDTFPGGGVVANESTKAFLQRFVDAAVDHIALCTRDHATV
ncbi:MAG: ACP phosphodiesterase [Actinobacteria bacterium HGW-Actinobacteria-4]|nr:MAG: ACP phosphodiesterase [Actinobacteria bacterium HGW-Actinobacteria-4]